jgi:hypothetical protein
VFLLFSFHFFFISILFLGNVFQFSGSIVQWVVPASGSYVILANGAEGGLSFYDGFGGPGASMQGIFELLAGQTLSILVGGQPLSSSGFPAGGGGTFVALGANYTNSTPLIVAGGGGGIYSNSLNCGNVQIS